MKTWKRALQWIPVIGLVFCWKAMDDSDYEENALIYTNYFSSAFWHAMVITIIIIGGAYVFTS